MCNSIRSLEKKGASSGVTSVSFTFSEHMTLKKILNGIGIFH